MNSATVPVVRRLANWRNLHDALYTLWLDSAGYEAWARAQLQDPNGRVHILGLEATHELNRYRRTYYWWFQDISADDFVPATLCPRCSKTLVAHAGYLVCEACSILVPNR